MTVIIYVLSHEQFSYVFRDRFQSREANIDALLLQEVLPCIVPIVEESLRTLLLLASVDEALNQLNRID